MCILEWIVLNKLKQSCHGIQKDITVRSAFLSVGQHDPMKRYRTVRYKAHGTTKGFVMNI